MPFPPSEPVHRQMAVRGEGFQEGEGDQEDTKMNYWRVHSLFKKSLVTWVDRQQYCRGFEESPDPST